MLLISSVEYQQNRHILCNGGKFCSRLSETKKKAKKKDHLKQENLSSLWSLKSRKKSIVVLFFTLKSLQYLKSLLTKRNLNRQTQGYKFTDLWCLLLLASHLEEETYEVRPPEKVHWKLKSWKYRSMKTNAQI